MHNLFDNSGPILLQKCYSISDEELDLIMDIVSIIIDCFLIDNFLLEEHEDNAVLRVVIARKFNLITNFGKLVDPLADKLTQISVLCTLLFKGIKFFIFLL